MPILNLSAENDIYYELIDGDPAKPWLVFLHEGLGCCAMWKDFPLQLCQATGCRGLLYDRLGYGLSSPLAAAARSITCMTTPCELPQVLAAVLPGQDHFLVGHSDGGSIALIYAAQQPPACAASSRRRRTCSWKV
jgi:pimeloyl-ACP methyl ester carboxylesterase